MEAAMAATITLDRSEYRISGKRRPATNFDRAAIMRAAHIIKRERREAAALAIFSAETVVVAGRPHHPRTLAAIIKATPVDFGGALKQAWADARRANDPRQQATQGALAVSGAGALALTNGGALATIGAALRDLDVSKLLSTVTAFAAAGARALDARFMAPRSGAALPVIDPRQIH